MPKRTSNDVLRAKIAKAEKDVANKKISVPPLRPHELKIVEASCTAWANALFDAGNKKASPEVIRQIFDVYRSGEREHLPYGELGQIIGGKLNKALEYAKGSGDLNILRVLGEADAYPPAQ